jgi:phenylacetaldehyde dehydrogenase
MAPDAAGGPSQAHLAGRGADQAHHEELAVLESLDNGKPITASRSYDVPTAWDHFYYMAGWATKIEGASVMNMSPVYLPGSRYHAFARREPIGVCGQITPWNFPLQMAAWKIAPALAAGTAASTRSPSPAPPRWASCLPGPRVTPT